MSGNGIFENKIYFINAAMKLQQENVVMQTINAAITVYDDVKIEPVRYCIADRWSLPVICPHFPHLLVDSKLRF